MVHILPGISTAIQCNPGMANRRIICKWGGKNSYKPKRFFLNCILMISRLTNPPNAPLFVVFTLSLEAWILEFSGVQTPAHGFQHVSGWRQRHLNKTRVIATTLSTEGVTSSQLKAGGQLRLPSSLTPLQVQSHPGLVVKMSRNGSWMAERHGELFFDFSQRKACIKTLKGISTKLKTHTLAKTP